MKKEWGPGCGMVVAGYKLAMKVRGAEQAQMHCQHICWSNLGILPEDTCGDNKCEPSCPGRLRQICHVEGVGSGEWSMTAKMIWTRWCREWHGLQINRKEQRVDLCPGCGSRELAVVAESEFSTRLGLCGAVIVKCWCRRQNWEWRRVCLQRHVASERLRRRKREGGDVQLGVNWAALRVWLVGNGWWGNWNEGSGRGREGGRRALIRQNRVCTVRLN